MIAWVADIATVTAALFDITNCPGNTTVFTGVTFILSSVLLAVSFASGCSNMKPPGAAEADRPDVAAAINASADRAYANYQHNWLSASIHPVGRAFWFCAYVVGMVFMCLALVNQGDCMHVSCTDTVHSLPGVNLYVARYQKTSFDPMNSGACLGDDDQYVACAHSSDSVLDPVMVPDGVDTSSLKPICITASRKIVMQETTTEQTRILHSPFYWPYLGYRNSTLFYPATCQYRWRCEAKLLSLMSITRWR